jgi:putative two-component system response regulator
LAAQRDVNEYKKGRDEMEIIINAESTTVQAKILTVDDTPANLTLVANVLKADYRVHLANNGAKALELASTQQPDLILLDVMMPEMDGFEVCRRLKADPVTSHIPVIFLTAKSQLEDEELGFSLGAVDFIHKPISPPIVSARVRTHIKIKLMQDYLQRENEKLHGDAQQQSSELNQLREYLWAPQFAKR